MGYTAIKVGVGLVLVLGLDYGLRFSSDIRLLQDPRATASIPSSHDHCVLCFWNPLTEVIVDACTDKISFKTG